MRSDRLLVDFSKSNSGCHHTDDQEEVEEDVLDEKEEKEGEEDEDEDGEKVEDEVLEEGEQEGEEEEEESDVVRELLSKHSAWLGLLGNFFPIIELLTIIPSDLFSKTYLLIQSLRSHVARNAPRPRLSTSRNPIPPIYLLAKSHVRVIR